MKDLSRNPLRPRCPRPEALARQLQAEARALNTDPQGSWTGTPTDAPAEPPTQDADDL